MNFYKSCLFFYTVYLPSFLFFAVRTCCFIFNMKIIMTVYDKKSSMNKNEKGIRKKKNLSPLIIIILI